MKLFIFQRKYNNLIITLILSIAGLLLCSNEKKNDKKFILNLNLNKNKELTINIFIGSSKQELNTVISIQDNNNIFFSEKCYNCPSTIKFNSELSQTSRDYNQEYYIEFIKGDKNETMTGRIFSDTFNLIDKSQLNTESKENFNKVKDNFEIRVDRIEFLLVDILENSLIKEHTDGNKEFFNYEKKETIIRLQNPNDFIWENGLIGLNINIEEIERNLFFSMWKQNQINSPQFTIFHAKKLGNSKIFIGDFLDDYNAKKFYLLDKIHKCGSFNENSVWNCEINSVKIKHRTVYSILKLEIDTTNEFTTFPLEFFNIIKEYIMEESHLNSNNCKFNEFSRLICICPQPNLFPDLQFNIENSPFLFLLKEHYDFYYDQDYQCHFKILISNQQHVNKKIIFGTEAIKNSLFNFNYKERKMGFYQLTDSEENILIKSLNEDNKINTTEETNDLSLKLKFLFGIAVIILILIGAINFSNGFKFALWSSNRKEEEKERKSLDYCKLTDENYVHSNENFNKNIHNKTFSSDFNMTGKPIEYKNNSFLQPRSIKNNDSFGNIFKENINLRKESANSGKNFSSARILEMKNLLKN